MKLITFLLIAFAIIFYSCGSDTVNNITNPPSVIDSLIFSLDSFVVHSETAPPPTPIDLDSLHSNKYKIVFDASTNDTSSNAQLSVYSYYYLDSAHTLYHDLYYGSQINQTYNKTIQITSAYDFNLTCGIGFSITTTGKYIRMNNIKIYIVH